RIDAGMRPGGDACEWRKATLLGVPGAHQDDGGGPVIDARCIAGRHRAVLLEHRLELAELVDRGAMADIFVLVDDDVALARGDRHGDDLVLDLARLLGGFRLVLRGDGELVLAVAGDLPLARDILGRIAHVIAVEGIPQAVLDHRVDHLEVAHLHAIAQMLAMRCEAHRFLAAGGDDLGIAIGDLLQAQGHGPEARATKLVDAPGRTFDRDAGADRSLACRILALPGRQDLPQYDLIDFRRFDL